MLGEDLLRKVGNLVLSWNGCSFLATFVSLTSPTALSTRFLIDFIEFLGFQLRFVLTILRYLLRIICLFDHILASIATIIAAVFIIDFLLFSLVVGIEEVVGLERINSILHHDLPCLLVNNAHRG